jgi:hypothetical protein
MQNNMGIQSPSCNSIMQAEYKNSNLQKEVDTITGIYQHKTNEFVNDNKTIVYSGVLAGGIYNTIHNQELKLSMPLKPLANDFSVDIKPNNVYTGNIGWKFSF